MKIRTVAILPLIGVAISITPVWADAVPGQAGTSPEQRAAVTAQLEAKQQQDWREAQLSRARGPQLSRHMDKNAQLQGLIDRLQSGQAVAPEEIDQALQPANR